MCLRWFPSRSARNRRCISRPAARRTVVFPSGFSFCVSRPVPAVLRFCRPVWSLLLTAAPGDARPCWAGHRRGQQRPALVRGPQPGGAKPAHRIPAPRAFASGCLLGSPLPPSPLRAHGGGWGSEASDEALWCPPPACPGRCGPKSRVCGPPSGQSDHCACGGELCTPLSWAGTSALGHSGNPRSSRA